MAGNEVVKFAVFPKTKTKGVKAGWGVAELEADFKGETQALRLMSPSALEVRPRSSSPLPRQRGCWHFAVLPAVQFVPNTGMQLLQL